MGLLLYCGELRFQVLILVADFVELLAHEIGLMGLKLTLLGIEKLLSGRLEVNPADDVGF